MKSVNAIPSKTLHLIALLREHAKSWDQALTARQERNRIRSFMAERGCEILGTGAFATVFAHRGLAIKVVETFENPAYLSFARYCNSHHKPMLPRVHGIVRVKKHHFVVMETLVPDIKRARPISMKLKKMTAYGALAPKDFELLTARPSDEVFQVFKKIKQIQARREYSTWDIHSGNILFRKEGRRMNMVLADPITY